MKYFHFVGLFVCFLYFLLPDSLIAQHKLSGEVKLNDSIPIQGALIHISELKLTALSNLQGYYSIDNIPDGTYLVQVSTPDFASQIKEVEIKGSSVLNFELTESNIELKELIVTGAASATERSSTPIPVSVVTQKDFLQNSAANIIDALARTPGVSQITEGPAISKPVIRGLGYNRVVVVNDGIRQEGQQWGDEFGIEVDEFSVNKVEIYKGPASLRYGSDAMAGVINMLPFLPLQEGKIKGNFFTNYQSNNGLLAGSFNLMGNIKGLTWDFRYTKKQSHDYKNKYDGYVWNSAYSENDVKGIVGINRRWGYSNLTLSSYDLKLGIVEGARDSATGKFTNHVLASDGSDSLAIAPTNKYTSYNYFPIIHQHVRHYKAVWDNNISFGKGFLGIRLGYQQNFRQEANDITIGDIYNNYFYLRTTNYDLRYVFPEHRFFELSVGINGMQQASQDRGTVFLVPEYNQFDLGVYTIAKKTFSKLSVSGGVRYDVRKLAAKDLYTDSSGYRSSAINDLSVHRFSAYNSNFSGISASLGGTYNFTKYVYGKFNLSRGYRAPNIAESGSNGIHDGTPFYEIGDAKLKPENSLQVDASIGINTEDISAEVNAFVNEINNYIFPSKVLSKNGGDSIRTDYVAKMSGPTFKYISGNAILSGGEAIFNIHPRNLKWLQFKNGFSMVNAIQRNQGDSTKYLPYTPPYKFLSELCFSFKKINNVFGNAYFKIGFDRYFIQNKIYYRFGDETVTPGYTLLNVGAGTDVNSNGKTIFSIFIFCSNLTNVAYQSNMSRLKYADQNNLTGRVGVYNMGRNVSIKLNIPVNIK